MQHSVDYIWRKFVGYQNLANLSRISPIIKKVIKTDESELSLRVIVIGQVNVLNILWYVHLHELVLLLGHPAIELDISISNAYFDKVMATCALWARHKLPQHVQDFRTHLCVYLAFNISIGLVVDLFEGFHQESECACCEIRVAWHFCPNFKHHSMKLNAQTHDL